MTVPRLVVLTDRSQLPSGRDLVATIRRCRDAGLTHVIVREHDLRRTARRRLVEELAALDGLAVISSRAPVQGAAGVHLAAAQQMPHPVATDAWFGRSCHNSDDITRAAVEGAAYVTLSPFATSVSKPGYGPPVAPADYRVDRGVPVLALGGVDASNAAHARASGAYGVAVMGAVMGAADPGAVVRALLREVV